MITTMYLLFGRQNMSQHYLQSIDLIIQQLRGHLSIAGAEYQSLAPQSARRGNSTAEMQQKLLKWLWWLQWKKTRNNGIRRGCSWR